MTILADLAGRVQAALRPLAYPIAYRVLTVWQPKAHAPAAAGATTLTLGSLPASFDGVQTGDTFSVGGPGAKTITADAEEDFGTVAVSFAPALVAAIPAGAVVPITRATITQPSGWHESVDVTAIRGDLMRADDTLVILLADTVAVAPAVGHQLAGPDGRWLTVRAVSYDATAAVWHLVAGSAAR